jgi:tetratricopeptide (TPR) repeat protein
MNWPFRSQIGLRLIVLSGILVVVLTFFGPALIATCRTMVAEEAMYAGDYLTAIQNLNSAQWWQPSNAEPAFLTARCYRRIGDTIGMTDSLKLAARLGYDRQKLDIEQTLYLAQTGELDRVAGKLPSLLQHGGDDLPAICEAYANGFLSNHQLNDAIQILNAWAADFPADPRPHCAFGLIYKNAGQFIKATESFREAIKRHPKRKGVRIQISEALISLHRYKEAFVEARQAVALEPENPDAFAVLGQALYNSDQVDKAQSAFSNALGLQSDHFKSLLALGQLHNDQGQYSTAIPLLSNCLKQKPYNVDVRSALGTALRGAGKNEEAVQHFEYCTEASRAHSRIRSNLDRLSRDSQLVAERFENGQLMLQYGSPSEAVDWLRSVIRLSPDHVSAHKALASFYRSVGDLESAEKHDDIIALLDDAPGKAPTDVYRPSER